MTDQVAPPVFLGMEMAATETTPQFGNLPAGSDTCNPPFAPTRDVNARAQAKPHTSCLQINVDPTDRSQLLELVTVVIREELLHGERKKFGLTRNIHLLHQQSISSLFEYLDGEIDAATAAERIIQRQLAAHRISNVQKGFLEAVDQYLNHQAITEPRWFDERIEQFADCIGTDPGPLQSDLQTYWSDLEATRENTRYQEVYLQLSDIGKTYSPEVAQHVADAALDIPYALDPIDLDPVTSRPFADNDPKARIETRLEIAIDAIESIEDPLAQGADLVETLREEIQGSNEWARDAAQSKSTVTDLSLPLLDATTRVENTEASHSFNSVPAPLDQIIAAAFVSPGNFGGVVFWNEHGDADWMVNPLLDEEYRDWWETTYVGDRLLDYLKLYLVDRHSDSREIVSEGGSIGDMMCPLCRLSGIDFESGCALHSLTDQLNEKVHLLRDGFIASPEYEDLISVLNRSYRGEQHE